MKKTLSVGLILLSLVSLIGCGSQNKAAETSSELVQKDLSQKDVDAINIGFNIKELSKELGKPVKIWKSDDFIYSQIDDAIKVNEIAESLVHDEQINHYKNLKEIGSKAKEIDGLELYQFEYLSSTDTKETFLAWVNPKKQHSSLY